MIDEKALIEVMLKAREREHSTVASLIDWFIQVVEACPKVGKWIPCSERLPEEDKDEEYYASVIVTLDDGRVADGCYRNADKEWWADASDGESYSENVTGRVIAWMPLPEPYKEEVTE